MVKSVDVIIVGGGIIGLMGAYFLSKSGVDVLIIEQHACGSGQSTRTGGGLRWHHASKLNMDLMKLSAPTWEEFIPTLDYRETGHLFLTNSHERGQHFQSQVKTAQMNGLDSKQLAQTEIVNRWAERNLQFSSGLYCGIGGYLNHHQLIDLMIDKVLALGVKIEIGLSVNRILLNNNKVIGVKTNEGELFADYVVNAAGAHAGRLAESCGYNLPIISRRHELLIARVPSEYEQFPWLIDVDAEVHVRPNTERSVLLGGFLGKDIAADPDDYNHKNDPDWIGRVLKTVNQSFNFHFTKSDVVDGWAGLYPGTPDYHSIIELSLPGLVTAAGFAGTGLMHSPAAGMILSELITRGKTDFLDMERLDSSRFLSSDEIRDKSGF